jgi:hypothetical protein
MTQIDTGMAIYANASCEEAEAHAQELASYGFQIRGMTVGSDRKVVRCADGEIIIETVAMLLFRPLGSGKVELPPGYMLESAGGMASREYLERSADAEFGDDVQGVASEVFPDQLEMRIR